MNNNPTKINLSFIALFIVAVVYFVNVFDHAKWNTSEPENRQLIAYDAVEYYAYLPALFVHKDLTFRFIEKPLPKGYTGRFWVAKLPNGKYTGRMTLALSAMMMPAFLVAHAAAHLFGYTPDGYTQPYQLALAIWGVLAALCGLYFCQKTLMLFFNQWLAALVVLALGIGTNLYHYASNENAMTHNYNFFLMALLLYNTVKWHNDTHKKTLNAFGIGFAIGMLAWVRPTDAVAILLPMLYGVTNQHTLNHKIQTIKSHKKQVMLALAVASMLVLVQLIYWKSITEQWFYFSYTKERFFWDRFMLVEYLFSYRKGWFVYTPIMFCAFIGLFIKNKKLLASEFPILLILLITFYIHSCWWCWWFGGSFGARSMIDFYPLMALPLAAFIQQIARHKPASRLMGICLMAFFIHLNLFQTRQYQTTLIHWDAMSKELYWKVFLTNKWPSDYQNLLSPTDAQKAISGEEIYR